MLDYYDNSIEDYIKYIENHIETFLMGQKPGKSIEIHPKGRTLTKEKDVNLKIKTVSEKVENMTTNSPGKNEISMETTHNIDCNKRFLKLIPAYSFPGKQPKHLNIEFKHTRKNISFISCNSISILVECSKCKKRQSASSNVPCSYCHTELSINFTPALHLIFLGNLSLANCKFVAFNPNKFYLSCCKCDAIYETEKMCSGGKLNFLCFKCKTELIFHLEDLIYKSEKKNQDEKRNVLKSGALPNFGTCKHYSKSKRWFRFPCCGLLFPCNVCHDESSDHIAVYANKMVCGLCSKEQSVSKECKCGNTIGKSATHWEGGKGMRDKSKMSKKDSKKYTK
ncbi:hypothetical protein COBT_002382 [Conglomerata obtusa]